LALVLKKFCFVILLFSVTIGCTQINQTRSDFDFDHQVQFKQQLSDEGIYHVKVISTSKTSFEQLASFIFRHAYKLCGSYGFTMEVINGVEGFDDKRISPSYIQPSLSIKLNCPSL